jgi:D-glycero-alpha-D-manno-heptose 1-phosphate guanylyltransferase
MEAVVLAGGLGTRLRGVIGGLPKALAPVCGRPFLEYLLARIAQGGVARAVIATGYGAELIEQAIGARFAGMIIDYSREVEPLGTGGALKLAAGQVRGDDFLALNGDTFVEVDLRGMLAAHLREGRALTVATVEVPDASRYGTLDVRHETLVGFREKGNTGGGVINAGVYAVKRELLTQPRLPLKFSLESDLLQREVEALRPLAFPASGRFIDIGVPQDYARAQTLFATA